MSKRQSILVSAVATIAFLWIFEPTLSFVLPESKTFVGHTANFQTKSAIDKINIDGNDFLQIPHEHNLQDASPSSIDRRHSLARMSWVAPALWAFPEMAAASSHSKKQKPSDTRSAERPVDFRLSAAVQKLLDLDDRLVPERDYAIDMQGRNTAGGEDAAPKPLFRYVDPTIFEKRPTYRSFVALLDNYEANVCLEEDNKKDETEEAYAFLRACMATPVLRYCYMYCKSELAKSQEASEQTSKRYTFDTEEEFVQLLYKIWFQTYSRSKGCGKSDDNKNGIGITSEDANIGEEHPQKINGSSGFEHVFVGEIRKNKVIGFHNWIQLYRQEQEGNVDYRGTRKSIGTDRLLTYNLLWKGCEKPFGSSLLGMSPEFELALYTMVFLVGNSKDNILLLNLGDGKTASDDETNLTKLDVKCFRNKGKVGTCYVESLL